MLAKLAVRDPRLALAVTFERQRIDQGRPSAVKLNIEGTRVAQREPEF
mgnify:CR=1 FL=1